MGDILSDTMWIFGRSRISSAKRTESHQIWQERYQVQTKKTLDVGILQNTVHWIIIDDLVKKQLSITYCLQRITTWHYHLFQFSQKDDTDWVDLSL